MQGSVCSMNRMNVFSKQIYIIREDKTPKQTENISHRAYSMVL